MSMRRRKPQQVVEPLKWDLDIDPFSEAAAKMEADFNKAIEEMSRPFDEFAREMDKSFSEFTAKFDASQDSDLSKDKAESAEEESQCTDL